MVISGKVLEKLGPSLSTILGGTLFGLGWYISSFGSGNFVYSIIGNGIIAGIGAGIAYIVPISTCIKWFPDKKRTYYRNCRCRFWWGSCSCKLCWWLLPKSWLDTFSIFQTTWRSIFYTGSFILGFL